MKALGSIALLAMAGCSGTPPCEDDVGAFVMAQEFIKRDLKAPATAEFPMITAEGVSSQPEQVDGRCGFRVRTYVDAENSFGAKLRQNYVVTLRPDDDGTGNWTLSSISNAP